MRRLLFLPVFAMLAMPAFAESINVKVDGMVCAFCAQGIEHLFGEEPSVEKVHVDIDKGEVQLTTHEGKDLSDARIKELVGKAGYDAGAIARAE